MPIPPPPDWLEEWEKESENAVLHPEYIPLGPNATWPTVCPQCEHSRHGITPVTTTGNRNPCPCPGCSVTVPKEKT
jgi:hypothetical protein